MEDQELINDFRIEALEGLQAIEDCMLSLEKGDEQAVNIAFRAMHSIKGNSGFLDLHYINTVAHNLEHLLDEVRQGQRDVTGELCDLLLSGIDQLRVLVNDVGTETQHDVEPFLHQINRMLHGDGSGGDATAVKLPSGATVEMHQEMRFHHFLIDRGSLDAAQVVDLLIEQRRHSTDELSLLRQVDDITDEQCLAVADLAASSMQSLLSAARSLQIIDGHEMLRLRQLQCDSLPPLAIVAVDRGALDRDDAKRLLIDYKAHKEEKGCKHG